MIPACEACGVEAIVLFPGTEPTRADPFDAPLTRGERGFGLCLAHAMERGWPGNMPSEGRQNQRQSGAGEGGTA